MKTKVQKDLMGTRMTEGKGGARHTTLQQTFLASCAGNVRFLISFKIKNKPATTMNLQSQVYCTVLFGTLNDIGHALRKLSNEP